VRYGDNGMNIGEESGALVGVLRLWCLPPGAPQISLVQIKDTARPTSLFLSRCSDHTRPNNIAAYGHPALLFSLILTGGMRDA